jgi:hypothetical protein
VHSGVNRTDNRPTNHDGAANAHVPIMEPEAEGGEAMIARIWRGTVAQSDRDTYARYMYDTGIAGYASAEGNRGVWMLLGDEEWDLFLSTKLTRPPAGGWRYRRFHPGARDHRPKSAHPVRRERGNKHDTGRRTLADGT